MTNDILKLLFNKGNQDGHKMKIDKAFLHFIANNSVNTFDRNIVVTGADEILANTRWKRVIAKLGYKLSKQGKGVGLVRFKVNGKDVIDVADIYDYRYVAGEYTMMQLYTGEMHTIDDVNYPVILTFEKGETGTVIKSEGIFVDNVYKVFEASLVDYKENTIPALPFINNTLGKADIPEEMIDLLKEMKFYGDELGVEWEKIKTQFLNNMMFGSGKDGDEWSRDMQSGKDVHDVTDPDGKLQGALATLTSGSTTPQLVLQNIQYIEDRILKYSGQFRETANGGTNKMNLEISQQNSEAMDYLLNKQEWRQEQLQMFFNLISDGVTVTINLPELTQMKLDTMRASIAQAQGQANQYNAQANLNNKQAELAVATPAQGE